MFSITVIIIIIDNAPREASLNLFRGSQAMLSANLAPPSVISTTSAFLRRSPFIIINQSSGHVHIYIYIYTYLPTYLHTYIPGPPPSLLRSTFTCDLAVHDHGDIDSHVVDQHAGS